MYTTDVQTYMNKFCELALAMEAHIEVGPPSSYPEVESKWHKFRDVHERDVNNGTNGSCKSLPLETYPDIS